MKIAKWILIVFIGLVFMTLFIPEQKVDLSKLESSASDYWEVSYLTGCDSKYSEDKKTKIFKEAFENKVLTWTGIVERSKDGAIDLNLDEGMMADVSIDLADENQGFDIQKGQQVTIKFKMEVTGGCFLPYQGSSGVIL